MSIHQSSSMYSVKEMVSRPSPVAGLQWLSSSLLVFGLALLAVGCGNAANSYVVTGRTSTSASEKGMLNGPADIELIQVSGETAPIELRQRNADSSDGKMWFVLGDEHNLQVLRENAEFAEQEGKTFDAIIEASRGLDAPSWFDRRRSEELAAAKEYGIEFDEVELLGVWPSESPGSGSLCSHLDLLTGKAKPKVYLGASASEASWQLPAAARFGNWNACPRPAVHCAVMRFWNDRYGAEIVAMTSDVIECVVTNPPKSRDEALTLAWQQYWYCEDIVTQGTETVSALAAGLVDSEYWYFWWD